MFVLRVIASMDPKNGGPCQGIRNSVPALYKLGVTTEVVCLDDPASAYLKDQPDSFPVHALGPPRSPWAYSKQLEEWLSRNLERFDAVIVHGLWLYHGYAVLRRIRRLNAEKPTWFVMPHGMLDPYFQKASGRRLKAVRNWIYWRLVEKNIVSGARGVLFTCEEELRLARESFTPYRPQQEFNIGYGIAAPPAYTPAMTTEFQAQCPEAARGPYLLFLSRIHEKKGVDLLVRAYNRLCATRADLPSLVIAGPGLDTPFGAKVKSLAGANDRILFPSMLLGEAKWGAFYGCEVFVLPSHQENFGIAVAEALACAKPVLISKEVNIWREILAEDGGMAGPDTEEGMYALLSAWLELSPDEKAGMSLHARTAYEKNFSIAQAAQKMKEVLQKK